MDIIQSFFLTVFIGLFKLVSPLFYNPILTTYIVILCVVMGIVFFNYRWLKKSKGYKRKGAEFWVYMGSAILQVFSVFFLLWYVVIHFWTYRLVGA